MVAVANISIECFTALIVVVPVLEISFNFQSSGMALTQP